MGYLCVSGTPTCFRTHASSNSRHQQHTTAPPTQPHAKFVVASTVGAVIFLVGVACVVCAVVVNRLRQRSGLMPYQTATSAEAALANDINAQRQQLQVMLLAHDHGYSPYGGAQDWAMQPHPSTPVQAKTYRGHMQPPVLASVIEEPMVFASEQARWLYDQANQFQARYPYNSIPTRLTQDHRVYIEEYGVNAWEFTGPSLAMSVGGLRGMAAADAAELGPADLASRVRVRDRTEVEFFGSSSATLGTGDQPIKHYAECLVATNLPLPDEGPVYYFEVKLMVKPEETNVAIGLATKPYPNWRLCGWNKHSVGIHTDSGSLYHNSPFRATICGERCYEGDVIGCGYVPQEGLVFFTRNGLRYKTFLSNVYKTFFPAVSANGPCQLSINLGQRGFVFVEANVKKWGLGPLEGSLLPPPKYEDAKLATLLESGTDQSDCDTLVSSRRTSMNSNQSGRHDSSTSIGSSDLPAQDWHLHPHDLAISDPLLITRPPPVLMTPPLSPNPMRAQTQSLLGNEQDMGDLPAGRR
ncbi:Protein ssh4 [Dimargaris verticillata]|uniref:Protein ssh4 n=1 Tax=Dimargaris verticillata TaxID=2761393 RepID=A0A9W8B5V8_9FUNG|nr:Protein ssh4 [Dimargaris verticillata]